MVEVEMVDMTNAKDCEFDLDFLSENEKMLLAADTLKAVKRFLAQPGGKEFLDNKIRELKEKGLLKNGRLTNV